MCTEVHPGQLIDTEPLPDVEEARQHRANKRNSNSGSRTCNRDTDDCDTITWEGCCQTQTGLVMRRSMCSLVAGDSAAFWTEAARDGDAHVQASKTPARSTELSHSFMHPVKVGMQVLCLSL